MKSIRLVLNANWKLSGCECAWTRRADQIAGRDGPISPLYDKKEWFKGDAAFAYQFLLHSETGNEQRAKEWMRCMIFAKPIRKRSTLSRERSSARCHMTPSSQTTRTRARTLSTSC